MLPADPTLSVAERVDAACDRFEAEWKADRKPRIDEFVAAAPESDREELRQALLALQLELQGRSEADTSVSRSSVRSDAKPAPEVTVDQIQNVEPSVGKVGRFEIRGVLGSGAFGKVYRAFDPNLSREVAVKVPLETTVRTDKERSLFLKEARSAANINHPNICQVHEVGEADGRPYIVMALVRGSSLSDTIKGRKEPLPEKQAALVVRKIALALAAAHDSGIVHRDLKPANVMFDRERKDIVVMDFGLARGPKLSDARGTQSGVIMGTPAYMSPEQARGDSKGVGPAGDIFSLGVILYELLTGTRPFTGTATEVIGKILHVEPEKPSAVRPGVDPRLEAICLKAMAKDTAARFASMKEFAAALDTVLRKPVPTGPAVDTAKANTTRREGEDESTSTRIKLAEVFAVLSDDRKQVRVETAAAVEAAIAKHRTPRWVFLLVGLFTLGGFAVLAGIVFFTRSDTMKVDLTVVLKDVDLADKLLTFFLNEEPISADMLAKPVELKPGVHIFSVKRGKEIVKRVEIRVEGGRNPGIKVEDIPPPKVEPPPPVEPKKSPELKPSPLDVLDAAVIPDAEINAVFGSRKKAPPELVAIYSNFLRDPRGDCAFWGFSLSSNGKILASSHYPYTIIEMHDLATGRKFGDAATKPGSWVQWCKISPDSQSIYYLGRDNKLHGADIRGAERWTRAVRSENWSGVALSPDGKTIIAADPDVQSGDVLVIDAKTGDVRDTWKELLDRPIGRFEFTPDGQQVVVISGPGKFVLASNGQPVNRPELEGLSEARFSNDGKTVYGSRWFKQVEPYCYAYDLASGKKTEYRLAPNGCMFLTPNPVFPVLVTHDNVNELHFWDSNRGPDQKPVRIPVGDKVHRYEWTPEGRYLVVAIQQRVLVFRLPVDKPLSAWLTATAKTDEIPAPKADGSFVPLFNGKDLSGWKRADGAPNLRGWAIRNGTIARDKTSDLANDGYTNSIWTQKPYGDFILEAEITGSGNSGIFFRNSDLTKYPIVGGLEMQINLPPSSKDPWQTGAIWGRQSPSKRNEKAGEWNTVRITAHASSIMVEINGEVVNRLDCDAMTEPVRLAGQPELPPLRDMPRKGLIGLQAHAGDVSFRNIRIKELKDDGFVPLFNGKDLAGWKTHPDQPGGWTVEDGYLTGRSDSANHLFSEAGDYSDFHLRAECRTNRFGNSGIYFRAPFSVDRKGALKSFPVGYEAQIIHEFPKPNVALTGSIRTPGKILPRVDTCAIKPDEWFTLEVIARGKRLVVKVNGVVTANVEDSEYTRGHLCLQACSDSDTKVNTQVQFRKIEIKELGFVPLFNGKDLTGWKTHESQPGNWKVVDGAIVCGSDGTGSKHLYSVGDDYKDFHFRMDVKLKDGSTGAMYRAPFGPTLGIKKEWVAGYNAKFDATRRGGIIIDTDPTLHRIREINIKEGEWATEVFPKVVFASRFRRRLREL